MASRHVGGRRRGWNGAHYIADRVKNRADDDGLPARFIFLWPDPTPIMRLADRDDVDAKRAQYGRPMKTARQPRAPYR
jgi:hypothetical protein